MHCQISRTLPALTAGPLCAPALLGILLLSYPLLAGNLELPDGLDLLLETEAGYRTNAVSVSAPSGINSGFLGFYLNPRYARKIREGFRLRGSAEASAVPYFAASPNWIAEGELAGIATRRIHEFSGGMSGGYRSHQVERDLDELSQYGFLTASTGYRINWKHPVDIIYFLGAVRERDSPDWSWKHSLRGRVTFVPVPWLLPSVRLGVSRGVTLRYTGLVLSPAAVLVFGEKNSLGALGHLAWRWYDHNSPALPRTTPATPWQGKELWLGTIAFVGSRELNEHLELSVNYSLTHYDGSIVTSPFSSHSISLGLLLSLRPL